jgi:predicted transcriptional regulator of viral defense system
MSKDRKNTLEKIYELVADQFGYLTAAQATPAGIERAALSRMVNTGQLTRVSQGVYRLVHFPTSRFDQYIEATLWPIGVQATLSHETALDLYELSDVNPARIHVSIPKRHRIRREVPKTYVIHRQDLSPNEVTVFEGIPITTPRRTILDCHQSHLGPALLRQAIANGRARGVLTQSEAAELESNFDITSAVSGEHA